MNRRNLPTKPSDGFLAALWLQTTEREIRDAEETADFERELELDMKREWDRDE